jgi:hypothetical protein
VLEVLDGACGRRPEDAVDPTGVEPDPGELRLELADVVAAQVRCDQQQQAIAELPRRLDDRAPGDLVADTRFDEATNLLEVPERRFGDLAEAAGLGTDGRETGGAEAPLQVADGFAALARGQWEVARNSSSSCMRAPLPLAPTIFFLTSPSWRTSSVGMLMTLYRIAMSGCSSTFSLVMVS